MEEARAGDHDSTVNEAQKTATSNSKDCTEYLVLRRRVYNLYTIVNICVYYLQSRVYVFPW